MREDTVVNALQAWMFSICRTFFFIVDGPRQRFWQCLQNSLLLLGITKSTLVSSWVSDFTERRATVSRRLKKLPKPLLCMRRRSNIQILGIHPRSQLQKLSITSPQMPSSSSLLSIAPAILRFHLWAFSVLILLVCPALCSLSFKLSRWLVIISALVCCSEVTCLRQAAKGVRPSSNWLSPYGILFASPTNS